MTPTYRLLSPRRLLTISAMAILIGTQAETASGHQHRYEPAANRTGMTCPLGTLIYPPKANPSTLCHPRALLAFYDPSLPQNTMQRETAKTYIQARYVSSVHPGIYLLSGQAKITRADQQIQAKHINYNEQTTTVSARGNVRYQQAGELLRADRFKGSTKKGHGLAEGKVRFQMLKSHGNGSATRAQLFDTMHSHYSQVSYSTCDIGHHLWEIRAKSLSLDKTSGRGVARNATMRLAKIPFLYLPYLSFPINKRRMSGWLYPSFGHTSRGGYLFGIPYYLNLAANADATLEPRLYSKRGAMLAGQARYLFSDSNGQLDFSYLAKDRFDDSRLSSSAVSTRGRQRWLLKYYQHNNLWPGWSFSTAIERASDHNYLHDFGHDLHTVSTGMLVSNAYLYGGDKNWSASLGLENYQNVDPSLPDSVVPYRRWPNATLKLHLPLSRWFEISLRSQATAFRKHGAVQGDRFDLYPYLDAYFQGASWFVHPRFAWRYTTYQLASGYTHYGYDGPIVNNQVPVFRKRHHQRSLPIASLDNGLVFERDAVLLGQHYTQTLEPRLYYLYVPYRRQNNLPLFDTGEMSFDYWQMFSPNSYSGADRQMNANNLTTAITTRLLDSTGLEHLSLSLGQVHYFTPQRVTLNGTGIPHFSSSSYVMELGSRLNRNWRLKSSYQWDPHTRKTRMGTMELQHRLGTDGVLNFSYRFRRNLLKQFGSSIAYPLSERWHLLGYWTYSAKSRRMVTAAAGFQYEGCCMKLSLLGRHYVTGYDSLTDATKTRPGTSNAVMFELEFKGIGTLNAQTESKLRRAILGYQ